MPKIGLSRAFSTSYNMHKKHSLASLAKVFKIDRYYISLTGMADEITIGQSDIETILDR